MSCMQTARISHTLRHSADICTAPCFKLDTSCDIFCTEVHTAITIQPVPALANEGPDCDPCGGPLKVIVQSKKRTNVLVH